VSAGAEQIVALKADADHGEVAGTGSLDRFDYRQFVIVLRLCGSASSTL